MDPFRLYYSTDEEIPEDQRAFYLPVEDDAELKKWGAFRLNIQGVTPKKVTDDFRTSNITLKQQVEGLEAKAADATALHEKIKELEARTVPAGDALTDAKLEEIRAEAVKDVVTARDQGFQERDAKLETMNARLRDLHITSQIQKEAADKIEPWAIQYAVMLGEQVWDLDANLEREVAYEIDPATNQKTQRMRYDENGEPLTISTWLKKELETRPEWILASTGGGAQHRRRDVPAGQAATMSGLSPVEKLTLARRQRQG